MAGKTSLGPAAYKLPPSVGGKQPDGRKADPPVWKFGTARARLLSNPPSFEGDRRPDYGPQPVLGPGQTLSRVRSEPAFGFGSAGRATAKKVFISSSHQRLDLYGMESPGPAHYASQSTIGRRGALARMANPPEYSLASRSRAPDSVNLSPGPHAAYKLPASIGQAQPNSTIARAATPTFGTGTRAQRSKLYMSAEFEKGGHGMHSPARWYDLGGSIGKQVSSKNDTRPRTAFTRRSRWAEHENELKRNSVPGPGAYNP